MRAVAISLHPLQNITFLQRFTALERLETFIIIIIIVCERALTLLCSVSSYQGVPRPVVLAEGMSIATGTPIVGKSKRALKSFFGAGRERCCSWKIV